MPSLLNTFSTLFTGIFHKLGDEAEGFRVFTKAEQAFFQVFGHLLSSHTLTLDQCPSAVTPIRQLVLNQASLFPTVFPDTVLRWKCLFKELRMQLIQRSSGNIFDPFFQWYTSQITTMKDTDPEEVHATLGKHLKREEQLLEAEAKAVLAEQSILNYMDLQSVLDDDVVAVDYVFFAPLHDQNPLLNAHCIIYQKEGKPVVTKLDFQSIRTHTTRLFYLLSNGAKSDEFFESELSMLAEALFPKCLIEIFAKERIKHVYLSADFDISKIPLDILPVSFGSHSKMPLYELLSVSFLSSMKQLIFFKRKVNSSNKMSFPTKSCCIIGSPNFNLTTPSSEQSMFEKLVSSFCNYLSISPPNGPVVEQLVNSQSEVDFVSFCLQSRGYDIIQLTENNATFNNVMSVQNPLLIHVSSHACGKTERAAFRGNFFSDLNYAVALAGFNTFSKKQFHILPSDCGPAQLPPLAIYSMKLHCTKLVFLSTCNSAAGESSILEAVNSLADAFITAGVETVIATLWSVSDESAATFAKYFYDKLVQPGIRPSEALAYAKTSFRNSVEKEWVCPAAFVCYGIDKPLTEFN